MRTNHERFLLSTQSPHLHVPPRVPKRADCIERVDSTHSRRAHHTVAMALKVERPRNTQLDLFVLMATRIAQDIGEDMQREIVATTLVAFAFPSVLTGMTYPAWI